MKKNLFFAFVAILCCNLTACGSDDDNIQEKPANALIGTWKHVIDSNESGENCILLTFKNNGACIFQEITYYNDYKPAIGHMNYVYDEQKQELHLTLIYFEDPSMMVVRFGEQPGTQETWGVIVGKENHLLIKTEFDYDRWRTFTRLQ